jgi:hypothetical protein
MESIAMDRVRTGLLAAGCLPMIAGLVAWARPAEPVPMAVPRPRPALAFHQYAVHLGEVAPAVAVGAHFDFVNRSNKPVRITGLKPSCGCLVTKIIDQRREYRPGEFGMFQASLATANEVPGPHDYNIKVSYDDGQPREETVRLTMTLPQKTVQLEPKEVFFYQLTGEADSKVVHLVDFRDPGEKPFEVTNVELRIGREKCPDEIAMASIEASEKAPTGETRIPIRIDVSGDVPRQRFIVHVVISTNDPEYNLFKLPVLIQGPKEVIPASATQLEAPRTVPN